ncbi:NAK/MPSK protein kinase [Saprolegnia parasitica CBS 223.65]|uniref:NAK/MPSK protein kinase n=1 Tax=Saprolegnia parasitica (strain CBS 223.65) TaxID=695850 RepID=A0A067CAJ5_SAPPC|nr:NAK/MPSK protein kinase [Saprolegnia parasitica CBS 223.65]KDO23837.1 NAK/MPSK protein kinase [Saprolegnia parasitica CBS 223.65]|eukprot:XP_012205470.1 NAK/MPSK protein kinase [Saprolegnia parasitica CBS 223.65]
MLVLYDILGDDGATPRHPNAFHVPDGREPLRLRDVEAACPFAHCHFSFQHENGVYCAYANPNSIVPLASRSAIHAKIVLSAPFETQVVWPEDVVAVEMPSSRTSSGSSNGSSRTNSGSSARKPQKEYEAPAWEATFADKSPAEAKSGLSATELKEKFKKQTEMAKDFAKNLNLDDAKRNAIDFAQKMNLDDTARKAKKWGGSLLSSLSNTISSASSAMTKGETMSIGSTNVRIVQLLAEGGYGQVFLVKTGANELCALKRVVLTSAEVEADAAIEREVLQTVEHPNLLHLLQYGESRSNGKHECLFLLPYHDHGTIFDEIQAANDNSAEPWPFMELRCLHILEGICLGLLALHEAGFAHRDLKPHNVLLGIRDHPILMDFGSCAPLVTEITDRRKLMDVQDDANRKCSAPYRAPELFEPEIGHRINGQSDVWSLGCILYCMAFGSSPFESPREGFMRLAAMNGKVTFPPPQGEYVVFRGQRFSLDFCDFIRDMLQPDPQDRPSVTDVLDYTRELQEAD